MSLVKFDSLSQLRSWLNSKGIDTSQWGKSDTKSLEHLWEEIDLGEAVIQDEPPRRIVKVVQILIRNGDKVLIEGKQKRGESWSRFRGYPPSEKILPGETTLAAALRCMEEELLVEKSCVKILEKPVLIRTETRRSMSFPGLDTTYEIHGTKVMVSELPNDTFWTVETKSRVNTPPIEHQWIWTEC